jgi:sugar phosphate isomerase/epimerase
MLVDTFLNRFLDQHINPEIGLDAEALDRFTDREFKTVAEKFHQQDLNITLHAPFMDLSAGSPDPAIREVTQRRFEQMLELVPVFRPKSVVSHAGYDRKRYEWEKDEWFERSFVFWNRVGERLRDAGSVLMLENVFEDDPEDMVILFSNLNQENTGFCLDPGHLSAFAKASLEAWLNVLGRYLKQVHLHDNRGHQDDHLALGRGIIDFDLLFRFLKSEFEHPPILTLEPHREEELWPSLTYLDKIWPWR